MFTPPKSNNHATPISNTVRVVQQIWIFCKGNQINYFSSFTIV